MTTAHKHRRDRGFTIPEMLAVVAIIAILLSMLMPTLSRARYEARTTICMSNRHQWALAMLAYAPESRGFLPRHDFTPSTGKNTWDASNQFPIAMKTYGVQDPGIWDCPVTPQFGTNAHLMTRPTNYLELQNTLKSSYSNFSILPFSLWVPRRSGGTLFPSNQVDPLAPSDGWAVRTSGTANPPTNANREQLPLLTDYAYHPTNVTYNWKTLYGSHVWVNEPESFIVALIDGHVERRPAPSILRRYTGNYHNVY